MAIVVKRSSETRAEILKRELNDVMVWIRQVVLVVLCGSVAEVEAAEVVMVEVVVSSGWLKITFGLNVDKWRCKRKLKPTHMGNFKTLLQ